MLAHENQSILQIYHNFLMIIIIIGLTSYSGTTFRVIIRYWHDLFSRSNSGTTFFDGSDTGTPSAFPLRWHFLFFPLPPGCHLVLLILSLSLSLSLSLYSLPLSSFSVSRHSVSRHSVSHRSLSLSLFQFPASGEPRATSRRRTQICASDY